MSISNTTFNPLLLDQILVDLGPQVSLIANDNKWDLILTSSLLECKSPLLKSLIGLPPRGVINKHTTVSSSVESHTQTLESFLASRVPKLQRYLSLVIG